MSPVLGRTLLRLRRVGAVALAAVLLGGGTAARADTPSTGPAVVTEGLPGLPAKMLPTAPVLDIAISHQGFTLPGENPRRPGWVTFRSTTEDTSGHYLTIMKLAEGVTPEQVVGYLAKINSPDPAVSVPAVKALYRDVEYNGGTSVLPGQPVSVSVNLTPGTYHVVETPGGWASGRPPYHMRTLEVSGEQQRALPPAFDAPLLAVDRGAGTAYVTPRRVGAGVTYAVANLTSSPQEAIFRRVVTGTTNEQLTAYYAAEAAGENPPSPFLGRSGGELPLAPGKTAILHIENLAPGDYAIASHTRDPETAVNGVYNGMHTVVTVG